ncbi:hypothetical protein [Wolbachia endosymbiont (group E) of Neria commutata]|uniref:hypothetical protein n=1 Tax=Wolbachia endosymbiont (group E) of Neria commutata TaxID=3066149 RepID=UPI0031333AB7
MPKKASGAYISLDDVNWKNYPKDVENVQKENNIPLSSPVSELSEEQVKQILTLTPPPVPKKIPGANKIGKYIYGHQNPEQLSIILEKKLFDMAAHNSLSENNIKFLQSRSAEDIFELKNPEGKTALEVAKKAGNQQFMDIAYSKLEGIKGDNQEINRKFSEFFIEKSEKTESTTVKERAKIFEKLGTNPADITQKALPSTGVIVSKIVEQLEKPIDQTESKGRQDLLRSSVGLAKT